MASNATTLRHYVTFECHIPANSDSAIQQIQQYYRTIAEFAEFAEFAEM
jgi:hypothetical protein